MTTLIQTRGYFKQPIRVTNMHGASYWYVGTAHDVHGWLAVIVQADGDAYKGHEFWEELDIKAESFRNHFMPWED